MALDQKDSLRLHHIIEAVEHVLDFTKEVSEEDFGTDYEKQSAVIRQFEIIGEAASKLTPKFTEQHKDIGWSRVVGMRHKMIHGYFDVDVSIVWTTVTDDIPSLKTAVERILTVD